MNRRLGLFGGSFDPPHIGHLAVAETAFRELKLDHLIFIPNGQPPHKSRSDMASPMHRLNMLRRLLDKDPRYSICELEIHREGPSYTVDTVRSICDSRASGQRPYFVVGDDVATALHRWKGINELLSRVSFVSVNREGSFADESLRSQVLQLPMMGYAVSSTQLRQDLLEGAPIRGRIPLKALSYIDEHRLYARHAKSSVDA